MPKLERFKREADKPTTKHILISAGIIVGLLAIFAVYKSFALYTDKKTHDVIKSKIGSFDQEDMVLTYTVEGEKSDAPFPKKINGYIAKSVTCQNGVTASWDSESWGLVNINANNQSKIKCNVDFDDIWEFDYIGDAQEFIAPKSGTYKIELWGAQGFNDVTYENRQAYGGYGGYVSGNIDIASNTLLYIYVGEYGGGTSNASTYNNGTASSNGFTGGGSTDVRLVSGLWNNSASINSRIMVAAGGGTGYFNDISKTSAGGLYGYNTSSTLASQTSIGSGANDFPYAGFGFAGGGCTSGNGYYPTHGVWCINGSGGGSSYISGHTGCVAIKSANNQDPLDGCTTGTTNNNCSIHYSERKFGETIMIDGIGCKWENNITNDCSGQPQPDGTNATGHSGNGFARITLIS